MSFQSNATTTTCLWRYTYPAPDDQMIVVNFNIIRRWVMSADHSEVSIHFGQENGFNKETPLVLTGAAATQWIADTEGLFE